MVQTFCKHTVPIGLITKGYGSILFLEIADRKSKVGRVTSILPGSGLWQNIPIAVFGTIGFDSNPRPFTPQ